MDVFLAVLGTLCIIAGVVGSVLPLLPGPPLGYLGLLLLHFTDFAQFSNRLLIGYALLTASVAVLDYLVPIWGTRKLGWGPFGTRGAALGLLAGLFLGPWGLILGPFWGALIGEWLGGRRWREALRAAWGSFLGFLGGTFLKLLLSLLLAFHFFKALLTVWP